MAERGMDKTPSQLIGDYLTAYQRANPRRTVPSIIYSAGYFRFSGPHIGNAKYRKSKLILMTETLSARPSPRGGE
jgi:hypothetical protein